MLDSDFDDILAAMVFAAKGYEFTTPTAAVSDEDLAKAMLAQALIVQSTQNDLDEGEGNPPEDEVFIGEFTVKTDSEEDSMVFLVQSHPDGGYVNKKDDKLLREDAILTRWKKV